MRSGLELPIERNAQPPYGGAWYLARCPVGCAWHPHFVGYEYVWDVQLLMQRQQVQTAQLGGSQQLGWTTWLAQSEEQNPSQEPIEGMVMEPEAYATH